MTNTTIKPQTNCKIAVIGLGCIYPGANSPLQLWENILARRRQFREMPDVRLPNKEYYDPDPAALNKTYQNKVAVIDGYEFNWLEKRIPKQTFQSTDIVHWLALDTALQAIHDSGYDRNNIPSEKTGVILGNTLTGEFTRSNQMLLRWPFVRKALRESARLKGLAGPAAELESTMEQYYKSVFYPVTEDTLAGGLANTIAGRICNYLDIHGGGYIVDGACSSSLLALVTAANYLELHQMDMVIAGGVDISLDTFELIGFAKTGALTPDEMRVYDKNGKGFIPGEGCGMVVLKRLTDALKDNNQIYAVIDGWGISSDGKGGITAPSVTGQSRALTRAHKKAGMNPQQLDFIEGHGTGTTVGDKVELEAISISLNKEGDLPARNCGVTSFKSIVGHTKAAAGIGAFIKAAIAVNRRILPPTAGLKEPNAIFYDKALALYPIMHGQLRSPDTTLYAGVSAMGFGGINSHVVLHSADKPIEKLKPELSEKKLMASCQTHELFLFSSTDRRNLIENLEQAGKNAGGISYAELVDFAYFQNSLIQPADRIRAALIADTPFDLKRKINVLIENLLRWDEKKLIQLENNTVIAGIRKDNPRIGAIFPGQGSQKINMARKLTERYDWAQDILEEAGSCFTEEGAGDIISFIFRDIDRVTGKDELHRWKEEIRQTNIAQPGITLSSLLWYEYLKKLGIKISCVSGHSLGELMAFYAAGHLNLSSLLRFSAFRGKAMAKAGSGTMASLQCPVHVAQKFIAKVKGYAAVANINGPEQTVVSGETDSIKQIIELARKENVGTTELPVSAAFHSELVADAARSIAFYNVLKKTGRKDTTVKHISSMDGSEVPDEADLQDYFARQAVNRVDFISTVHAMSEHCDIILEIGPGKILSGLISGITDRVDAFPIENAPDDDLAMNVMLGNIFVSGSRIDVNELYSNRLIRPFIPASEKKFLVNPLERTFPEVSDTQRAHINSVSEFLNLKSGDGFNDYIKVRGNFIREIIDTDFKYFKNLPAEEISSMQGNQLPVAEDNIQKATEFPENNLKIRELLYNKIQAMTGFDAQVFSDQMKLLDDFNLDSIKAATLLNTIAKTLGVTGKINTTSLSNASLSEIMDIFIKVLHSPDPGINNNPQKSDQRNANVINDVYDELAKRTGFPREALSGDHKLLDDLNMDSIKAGAFISQLLRKYNIQKKNNVSSLANASINDFIRIISEASIDDEKHTPENEVFSTSWVNSYSVVLQEEPLEIESNNFNEFWKEKSVVILHTEDEANKASKIENFIKSIVARVGCVSGNNLHSMNASEITCLIVMITDKPLTENTVHKTVRLLTEAAHLFDQVSMVCFLQFNDGSFLKGMTDSPAGSRPGVVSFAASIHHEKPELKIRVVETAEKMQPEKAAMMSMREIMTESSFDVAGYDLSGIRRKMKYQRINDVDSNKKTILDLRPDDVVIVTGGARGITAECMLSLAQRSGCKTALIGSSALGNETQALLDRYKSSNLVAGYFSCDISEALAVKETVRSICNELGTPTILFHGAGRNIPRKIEQVSPEDALTEIAPKLSGFFNISEALSNCKIRYCIALTSIIGVTGMPGNSWYAFSNENLDLYLRTYSNNKNIPVRTIAYSIWDEIGMGARMGSNRLLSAMGIGSIKPSLGIEKFIFWMEHESSDQQIVVSSRMGSLDTWNVIRPEMPARRFISDLKTYEPGRELFARVKLSRSTDLYLNDHNYNGSLLFPTVFGLEAMAQASYCLVEISEPSAFVIENILLNKPIVVPHEGEIQIGISAHIMEPASHDGEKVRIHAGISTEESDFKVFHFSAEFIIDKRSERIPKTVDLPGTFLRINPVSDLYTWLLFQGPRFQHIERVYDLTNNRTVFTLGKSGMQSKDDCFSEDLRYPMITGNPLVRDVLLQSVQLYLTQNKYLPISIKRWEIFDRSQQAEGIVLSKLTEPGEDNAICSVELTSGNQLKERISGYEVKALESTPGYPVAEAISEIETLYQNTFSQEFARYSPALDGIVHCKLYKHYEEFNKIESSVRHDIEQTVFQSWKELPVQDQASRIMWTANGKPSIENCNLSLSISHSRSVLMMTAGINEQGCDIEFVNKRTAKEWGDLLEDKFSKVVESIRDIDKNTDISFTRTWCVREALIKSFGLIPLNISIEKIIDKAIFFKALTARGEKIILTFPVEFLPSVTAVVAMVVNLKKVENPEKSGLSFGKSRSAVVYNKDHGVFSHTFLATFKDCRGFSGKTHFTSFTEWMGTVRELVLAPIGADLVKDVTSGKFGMVTNSSEIHIRHEAGTLDEITGNLWITDQSDLENSLIDLDYEFYKKNGDKDVLLANCRLSTTWVAVKDRGLVKKSRIPGYFMDFLKEHKRKNGRPRSYSKYDYPEISEIGTLVYHNNHQPRPTVKIHEHEFPTGLTHGNTVGNLYYSNYYLWQSRMIEDYLHGHVPEIMTGGGKNGEILTLHSTVNHLQEAMPFDKIQVSMYIQEYYENGIKFYFEYYRSNGKMKHKLAFGSNTVLFCSRDNENSLPVIQALPRTFADEILKVIH